MSCTSSCLCPLCGESGAERYHEDNFRRYYKCPVCFLVFVPSSFHLGMEEEKALYDLHENDPHDEGYRKFHSRLFNPLSRRIRKNSSGLDFGCGDGSALCAMLEESGHRMKKYDKFYEPDRSVLEFEYDFICAAEVVEHLPDPMDVLEMLFGLLKAGGYLCIMTKLVTDREAFAGWHYTRDPSHICYFRHCTFRFLADRLQGSLTFPDRDVIFIRKT